MKKLITIAIASLIICLIIAGIVYSQARVVVKEQITITVDKAQVTTDVPPIMVGGYTLVPIRGVFNAFHADIQWFPIEKRVFIRDRESSSVIWLQIGDAHAKVNDVIVPMSVPARIYRGRTMVPLRFIAETLGATVNWNPETQTITIITRQRAVPEPEEVPAPATVPETETVE